jgi:hypothetical protein
MLTTIGHAKARTGCFLHNTAACESAAASAVRKTDVIIETRFRIIFIAPPFFVIKNRQWDIGGQGVSKSYSRMTTRFSGCPYFITAAPRPSRGIISMQMSDIFLDTGAPAPLE